jgi:hypothetical protein
MICKFFFHNLFGNTINQWTHYFATPTMEQHQFNSLLLLMHKATQKQDHLLILMRGADRVYLCVCVFPLTFPVPLEGGNLVLSVREGGRGGGFHCVMVFLLYGKFKQNHEK